MWCRASQYFVDIFSGKPHPRSKGPTTGPAPQLPPSRPAPGAQPPPSTPRCGPRSPSVRSEARAGPESPPSAHSVRRWPRCSLTSGLTRLSAAVTLLRRAGVPSPALKATRATSPPHLPPPTSEAPALHGGSAGHAPALRDLGVLARGGWAVRVGGRLRDTHLSSSGAAT